MRLVYGLVAVMLLIGSGNFAMADLRGLPDQPPVFTADERALLEKNPALAEIARLNPFLVKALLDDLTKPDASHSQEAAEEQLDNDDQALIEKNPALSQGLRSSPEAALDLIKIIKEAARKK